jgi:hypothetical protein
MAKRHIYVDKTELVLIYPQGKKYISTNLTYEQIICIRISPFKEFRLFFPVASEKIEIVSGKHEKPIVFTKLKEKGFFEQYKKELAEFAARNRVSFAVKETF